jgi:manganese transport protein
VRRLGAVLFWSVLAAAFIGPGTVTTCASAGAHFGPALLWTLTFSTFACVVLQEAAARITVASGANLGEALRRRSRGGVRGALVLLLVLTAIVLGCAAYEAGNILGAAAGAALVLHVPAPLLALAIGGAAALLLWAGSTGTVAKVMSGMVAVMGVAFLVTAVSLGPDLAAVVRGSLLPALPEGSALLALGLVGTTVVPYNLFLGSGIAAGQGLGEARFGITVAVVLGGAISMAILVVGAAVSGSFSYQALAGVLAARLGDWAAVLFAVGLFAAGFTSAVTAPLAAAVTARSLFAGTEPERWEERRIRHRAVWGGVLLVGVVLGASGLRPIPAIILAQAANGVLLPLVVVFLLVVANDRRLMGDRGVNGPVANVATAVVTTVAVTLGCSAVVRAGAVTLGASTPSPAALLLVSLGVVLLLAGPLVLWVARARRAA